ncbi:MAG: translation initiation factor [Chloroflexota bacterium]
MANKINPTVWSSENGDQRKKEQKSSPARVSLAPNQQTVYLHRDNKHRGGKGVTLLKGLMLTEQDMVSLAKQIKQSLGSGGTVKEGVIEIQGDNREKIGEILLKLGFKIKMAGG